jgi:mercuric ion binding protein
MWKMLRVIAAGAVFALVAMHAQAKPPVYALAVDGLACPFCAYGIEKKLKAINGVVGLEVDIAKGVVRVTMAEGAKLDEAAARKAVEAAGFTLRRFDRIEKQ